MILLFSDLHIGSVQSTCTVDKIKSIIDMHHPRKVYFVGDTLDIWAHPKYMSSMVELLKVPNSVFINGNHDPIWGKELETITIAGKRVLLFHGHQYDGCTFDKYLTKINEFCVKYLHINLQLFLRKLTTERLNGEYYVSALLKQRNEIIKDFCDKFDLVITGHTHCPEKTDKYVNLGNWKNFTTIDEDGTVNINMI